jgi:hypothetical protein
LIWDFIAFFRELNGLKALAFIEYFQNGLMSPFANLRAFNSSLAIGKELVYSRPNSELRPSFTDVVAGLLQALYHCLYVAYVQVGLSSLRIEVNEGLKRWQSRSAAMAAGLTDHVWTIEELLMRVVVPKPDNA